jgi:hypothetical protein
VAVIETAAPAATGFGEPDGGVVKLIVWGCDPTICVYDPVAVCPDGLSLTVTPIVQFCEAPVALAGAVHVGPAAVALGVKVPLLGSVGQLAVHW